MKLAATAKLKKSQLPYDLGYTVDHAKRVLGQYFTPGVDMEIRKIVKSVQQKLRRFGGAARDGKIERTRSLEYLLSTSYGYRVISVLHGYPKGEHALTWKKVKELADKANPRLSSGETVNVSLVEKSSGGKRIITKFGPVARANQAMARDMVHLRHGPSKYEYARKGRGREKLMETISNKRKGGAVHALGTMDIEDCFPSIDRKAVNKALKVSKAIREHTLYIHDDVHVDMKNAYDVSEIAVRAGLSQGALSSVIVAGKVIEPCLDGVQAPLKASYIDNITIGGKSVDEVQAFQYTLTVLFEGQYPGSPLFLKERDAFKIGRRSDVLGYWPRTDIDGLR